MSALNDIEELAMFRDTVRKFFERELVPRGGRFKDHADLRAYWRKAGDLGLLGASIPEQYGGPGLTKLSVVIIAEELGRLSEGAVVGANLTSDMATCFLVDHGSEAQKREWLPKILSGEAIQTMALTEPGAGSDAGAIVTSARRDGDEWVIKGSKTFISNGSTADLIYLIAKTESGAKARTRGMSAFIVPATTRGVSHQKQQTLGYKGGDTAALFFDDVRIPAENLIGEEGNAFVMFDTLITLDRFHIASRSWCASKTAFELTVEHARNRKMFNQRLIDMQNTQFTLAKIETDLAVGRAFIDRLLLKYLNGTFGPADGAMLKIWLPEMEGRVMDACVQLWGGYGWMEDQPITQMFTAARLQRIWAGATELHLSQLGRRYTRA